MTDGRTYLKQAAVALGIALLPGCAALSSPPDTYTLSAPSFERPARAARGLLVVAQPVGVAAIDSQRIVARPSSGEVTYVSNAQWADQLSRLLQAQIIAAFQNANRLAAVGRPGDRLAADYQLVTEIRTFEVTSANQAVVELAVKIVGDRTGRIVAAEIFRAQVPISGVSGATAAKGLDAALAQVLREMVDWASARV